MASLLPLPWGERFICLKIRKEVMMARPYEAKKMMMIPKRAIGRQFDCQFRGYSTVAQNCVGNYSLMPLNLHYIKALVECTRGLCASNEL